MKFKIPLEKGVIFFIFGAILEEFGINDAKNDNNQ
jgi:hypothetical protein